MRRKSEKATMVGGGGYKEEKHRLKEKCVHLT